MKVASIWPRAIVFVDMDAFFASIEQRDRPELRGKPIGITNGEQGTCIITCSYEARAYGIHTGMRLPEARRRCPGFIRISANPRHYAAISKAIMQALQDISPDREVFSVDEAFLDVTHCQRLHGSPLAMAQMARQRVWEVSGLPCTVGVSGDKSTAKYAAKRAKPDGLGCIFPWEARAALRHVPVTELSGVGQGIGAFLARHGAHTCGEVADLPVSVLARRFGNLGRRIWCMCQGADPEPVRNRPAPPKSLGHGKILPPNTRDGRVIRVYLHHMGEKVAARLRRNGLSARYYTIGLRTAGGWLGGKYATLQAGNDSRSLIALCDACLEECWAGQGIFQVQITAQAPRAAGLELDLFAPLLETVPRSDLDVIQDSVNTRYGEFTLAPLRLLERTSAPDVIAPAWQPEGARASVST